MRYNKTPDQEMTARRRLVMVTAEDVLARIYARATPAEMKESQLRIREIIVAEMKRRVDLPAKRKRPVLSLRGR